MQPISEIRKQEIVRAFQVSFKRDNTDEIYSISLSDLKRADEMLGDRDIQAGYRIKMRNRISDLETQNPIEVESKPRIGKTSKIKSKELLKLCNIVIARFDMKNWTDLGLLTGSEDEIQNHSRLFRSMYFGDDDYDYWASEMVRSILEKDANNKAILEEYLSDNFDIGEEEFGVQAVCKPSVFNIPKDDIQSDLVAVMMPFAGKFDEVYTAIREACSLEHLKCQRADDIWEHSVIIQDVFTLIYRSSIVVCDFTDKNSNVFYEAGIAHTLGREVIPITQNKSDIPFDLQHHRFIQYYPNTEGIRTLKDQLITRLSVLSPEKPPEQYPF